ncbi:hypothetical protein [Arachidicoccus sp.]
MINTSIFKYSPLLNNAPFMPKLGLMNFRAVIKSKSDTATNGFKTMQND